MFRSAHAQHPHELLMSLLTQEAIAGHHWTPSAAIDHTQFWLPDGNGSFAWRHLTAEETVFVKTRLANGHNVIHDRVQLAFAKYFRAIRRPRSMLDYSWLVAFVLVAGRS